MVGSGRYDPSDKYRRLRDPEESRSTTADVSEERRRVACVWSGAIVVLFVTLVGLLCAAYVPVAFTKEPLHAHSSLLLDTTQKLNPLPDQSVLSKNEKLVSCYYNIPDERTKKQLKPLNIDPHLCTHINVAFASIIDKKIFLDESMNKTLLQIIKLKDQNHALKIILSIGGAGNNNGFSDVVVTHASRKIFIRSIKSVLRNFSLDGIDLDWEFPALHGHRDKPGSRERQHYSQLLREIRMEFDREKRNYILTMAAAAPETIVDVSYDVDQINLYVDYVNIMTYDFHYYTKYTPFTGFNSPLYPRPTESLFLATLNINYTVNMYLSKGLDRNKILVGIPTYGHTFKLVNVNNANVGSPASGFGSLGHSGFVDFSDVCLYLRNYKNTVEVKYDEAARVPYLHRAEDWVSYEDPWSVAQKGAFVKSLGLRGAMIYSLNADDYERGFPLTRSVLDALKIGSPVLSESRT